MEIKNSKKAILTPLVLGLILIVGIFIGNKILPVSGKNIYGNFSEYNNKIGQVLGLLNSKYVDNVSLDSLQEIAIPHILNELDPHSIYIPPTEMKDVSEHLEGSFVGIGIKFNIQNDTIIVINTISGGPSEKQGLLAGDKIITINDSLFAGIGIKNNDVPKNLKGEKDTKVKLGIKRQGISKLLNFEITRDDVPIYSVDAGFMIKPEIGYIKINSFTSTTFNEFIQASQNLQNAGMKKLILDLRENGGGYLMTAVKIIDEFLEKDKMIVYTKGQNRKLSEFISTKQGDLKNIKLVVLIDSWSASASEIVAGAIQDNDRGTIIGRRSFGKGLVQETNFFKDGSGIRITTARYYMPTGRCIQKPYSKNPDEYYYDLFNRAEHGELENKDSINFNDTTNYITPAGKKVYAESGIMPDIFVPKDTSYYSEYLREINKKQLLYEFSMNYTDKHRLKLNKFKDYTKIISYLNKTKYFDEFISYAENQGIKTTTKGLDVSRNKIDNILKAYIVRNILKENDYYKVISSIDKDIKAAINVLTPKK